MDPLQAAIGTLWRGELPLWVAFWVYAQGVYAVILASYIAMYKLSFDALAGVRERFALLDGWVAKVLGIFGSVVNAVDLAGIVVITGFFTIAVWRCAPNTDWMLWTWLARGYMVMFWVFVAVGVYALWQLRQG